MKPDDFRRLVSAGLSTDQIAIVMEMMDREASAVAEQEEVRKAQGRARWRKWKHGKDNANVSKHEPTLANNSRVGVAPVEDKSLTQKIEPQENKKQNTAASGVVAFKAKLAPLLEADLLEAFVAVRKTKRGALTGYAAGLFIADAEKCGMAVAEAAKECVRSSWITVKPEYFHGRPRGSPPGQQAPSMSQLLQVIRDQPNEIEPEPPEDRSGLRQAIPYLRAAGSG